MCSNTTGELTFESMLCDPLIRMVMASDGVNAVEFVALMMNARQWPGLQVPKSREEACQ